MFEFGDSFRRDQVGLGESHDAAPDPEELHDLEVFNGLRHYAVVSCYDQDTQLDTGNTGNHVFDELFMAGNVNDPQVPAAGQIQ